MKAPRLHRAAGAPFDDAVLVVFGGAIVAEDLIQAIRFEAVVFALAAIFIIRPVGGWVSLLGCKQRPEERAAISFFGIRGLGSAYYLAYGLNHGKFENPDLLWSTMSLIVLISILLHGTSVTPVMSWLDRRSRRLTPNQIGHPGAAGPRAVGRTNCTVES